MRDAQHDHRDEGKLPPLPERQHRATGQRQADEQEPTGPSVPPHRGTGTRSDFSMGLHAFQLYDKVSSMLMQSLEEPYKQSNECQ